MFTCSPLTLQMKRMIPAQPEKKVRRESGMGRPPSLSIPYAIKPNCTNCTHRATFSPCTRRYKTEKGNREVSFLSLSCVLFCIFPKPIIPASKPSISTRRRKHKPNFTSKLRQ
ncbi:hypothetical protein TNIN_381681 [Trichonephila inaurata madagascariensis]|uniref:Uncharacterized protein n=1 Tax=Trichonephila inaurata madagascariensis TaxID=2747483 RepID=A0A8X7CPU6_9ARAC|nr:hypothetical protein TNIN_381681 [Trichonephila inaurata madagascariensis]